MVPGSIFGESACSDNPVPDKLTFVAVLRAKNICENVGLKEYTRVNIDSLDCCESLNRQSCLKHREGRLKEVAVFFNIKV